MAARALASASISFGLVSIPVKLFTSAKSSSAIRFHQIGPDGARVKQQYISAKSGDIVARDEMKKGYEFAKGQYVIFDKEELKALEAQSTQAIEIKEFVPLSQVDPIYYDKAYYLGTDKGGAKAYHLLRTAMEDAEQVAIGKYASRGKDYLVLLRPVGEGIIMEQLHYAEELRDIDEVPIDEATVDQGELKLAKQLIDQVSSKQFKPDKYKDEVRQQVLDLIEKKVAGEEISVEPEAQAEGKIIDLMEALKASLDSDKKPAKRVTKKTAAKTKASKRKSA